MLRADSVIVAGAGRRGGEFAGSAAASDQGAKDCRRERHGGGEVGALEGRGRRDVDNLAKHLLVKLGQIKVTSVSPCGNSHSCPCGPTRRQRSGCGMAGFGHGHGDGILTRWRPGAGRLHTEAARPCFLLLALEVCMCGQLPVALHSPASPIGPHASPVHVKARLATIQTRGASGPFLSRPATRLCNATSVFQQRRSAVVPRCFDCNAFILGPVPVQLATRPRSPLT